MLCFGIELALAFSIAFWSARFAVGSGPPSFAATMIARESFENSLPRFASAAPFLCLIDDHLLCPDMRPLPDQLEELLVHARIPRQLRVESRDAAATLAREHGEPVELLRLAHLDHLRAEAAQHRRMLAEVALHGQDADVQRPVHRGAAVTSRGSRAALPARATRRRGPPSDRRGPARRARGS